MWKSLPACWRSKLKFGEPSLSRLGERLIRYRLPILAIIGLLTILFALQLRRLHPTDDENTWFSTSDPILEDYRRFREEFPIGHNILIAYNTSDPLDATELRYLRTLEARLLQLPYTTEVLSLANVEDVRGTAEGLVVEPLVPTDYSAPMQRTTLVERIAANPFVYGNLVSRDWRTLTLLLKIEIPPDEQAEQGNLYVKIARELRRFLDQETQATGKEFHFSSELVMDGEINAIIYHDVAIFFPLSLLVSFLIILYLFRTPGAVVVSLSTITIALIWTLGLMGWLNVPISPVSVTLFALINIIGLANAIHLLSQLRVELDNGYAHRPALLRALDYAGKPCFFTSLTTAVGFGSLAVSRIPAIRHLGYFAGFGVMIAYLMAIVLIPVLAISPRFRLASTSQSHVRLFEPLLQRIAHFNRYYPRLIMVVNVVLIVGLAGGISLIRTEASLLEYLKKSSRLYRDTHFIDAQLTGVSNLEVVFRGNEGDFSEPATLELIEQLQDSLRSIPNVGATYAPTDLLKMINRALNAGRAEMYRLPSSREAIAQSFLLYEISGGELLEEYVSSDYASARLAVITKQSSNEERQRLLSFIREYCQARMPQYDVTVTGVDYLINAITNRIIRTQISSLLLAFGVIAVLMILQFGWRAGLVSLLPNLFPIVLTLGLMGLMGFKLNMATSIIASIAIGIVVDDTIHYFTHFKTQYRQYGDRQLAMQAALLEVGPAMIAASLVLVLGFTIEMLSQTSILLEFGILSGVAILSALVGDLFMGPVLLSRWRVFEPKKGK